MENYLFGKVFKTYISGVPNGKIIFEEKNAYHCRIDRRTRTQLNRDVLVSPDRSSYKFKKNTISDYASVYKELDVYTDARWEGECVMLPPQRRSGPGEAPPTPRKYRPVTSYLGVVDGKEIETTLWGQMESMGSLDVLVSEGKVIGFSNPGRVVSEVTVLEGYECVSPLIKFDAPFFNNKDFCGVNAITNVMVPCQDGVRLATDVFLPCGDNAPDKMPTIVVRDCYSKEHDIDTYWPFVARGYAVVIQDVRGRSYSEGDLIVFNNERDDANDLFNWIAEQPWSNRKIGMWGASYLGFTTTSAATSGNPYLKCAISEVNVGSAFIDTARKGGAVCSWPLLSWVLAQTVGTHAEMRDFKFPPPEIIKMRPIKDIPQMVLGKNALSWDLWSKHYYYDEFWRRGDNTAHADNIRCPMLIMSGWFDGDALGVQETWKFLTELDKPGRRIVLGPWVHGLNANRGLPQMPSGANGIDYDFDTRILRWFDHYLKDIDNGEDKKPRATYYLMGENEWHTSEEWPPVGVTYKNLYLKSGGRANSLFGDGEIVLEPADSGSDSFVYDPEKAYGTGANDDYAYMCAPDSMNNRQMRGDTLVYTTPELEADVTLAGQMYAELYLSSTAVDTDIIARVSDVDEKGETRLLSFGLRRAEFRKGWDKPEKLVPGEISKIEFEMRFHGITIPKGRRLRIDICSAEAMEVFPNTNTGIDPYLDPTPIVAVNTIHHTKEYPSHIKVPVLKGL